MMFFSSKKSALLVSMSMLIVFSSGCGGYGEVSPVAYDFSMALYSISNRRDEMALEPVSHQIEAALEKGDISRREAKWLLEIVGEARRGKWERAGQAARRMMEDQVE